MMNFDVTTHTSPAAPDARATLRLHGLVPCGAWAPGRYASVSHLRDLCAFGLAYEVQADWRTRPHVVYAFVAGEAVLYVGETSAGMAARFAGYRYGNPLVSDTDNRVKLALTRTLQAGGSVAIWATQPQASLSLPDGTVLTVPASKPLEEVLIARIRPELNVKMLAV